MNMFSKRSLERLKTCDIRLQKLFKEVVKHYDCTIVCGYRNEEDQNKAYKSGNSKLKFPKSKHNVWPSLAVDVVPYPSMWDSKEEMYHFAGYVNRVAEEMGLDLRWGGAWNGSISTNKFMDLGHWEIK